MNHAFRLTRGSDLKKEIISYCQKKNIKAGVITSSTGQVKSLLGLNGSIEGRHVIVVEDIVDTGESIEHMLRDLEARRPASVAVCTLFFKPASYRKSYPIQYRAMEIGNEFIVGYGLDYDQLGRSLKDIYVVTE